MPRKPDAADVMLQAVADYLKSKGWKVLVIGTPRVQKQPEDRDYNYEFAVKFTGAPPKKPGDDPS